MSWNGALFLDSPTVPGLTDDLRALLDQFPCCMGSAGMGPEHCTCWEPTYDLEQSTSFALAAPTCVASRCCEDCAFRPDSPEWAEKREWLLSLPSGEGTFWCHQGMRAVVEWRHPELSRLALEYLPRSPLIVAGELVLPAGPGDYCPPLRGDDAGSRPARPFRADGTPGLICAGWAARAPSWLLTATLRKLDGLRAA